MRGRAKPLGEHAAMKPGGGGGAFAGGVGMVADGLDEAAGSAT